MAARQDAGSGRLDDAARAGWLYYVAGNTQDQIAAKLGVSRQSAQRLVSLATSEGLVKVQDRPSDRRLPRPRRKAAARRFALDLAEVVPSDPASSSTTMGIAEAAAAEIERRLSSAEPIVHGARYGSYAEGGDRAASRHGLPAAQDRVADWQHFAGRLRRLLQRRLHHGRPHQGALASRCRCRSSPHLRRSARCCSASR